MTSPVRTVACFACRSTQNRDAAECGKCGQQFKRICACGVEGSLFDARCSGCGRRQHVREVRFHRKRMAAAAVVAAALAGAGAWAWRKGDRDASADPWRVRDRAQRLYQSGDFGGAATAFRELTVRSPRDADAWAMLALSLRAAGFERDAWREPARKAHEIDPRLGQAVLLLAEDALRGGDDTRARTLLRSATEGAAKGDASAWRLLAGALLAGVSPDHEGAEAALARAHALGDRSVGTLLDLARLRVARTGWLPAESQPPEVVAALREAETALETGDTQAFPASEVAAWKAEVRFALGDLRAASDGAARVLAMTSPAPSAATTSRMHLLLARTAVSRRDGVAATSSSLSAILSDPGPGAVHESVSVLLSNGFEAEAVVVLERASADRHVPPDAKLKLAGLHADAGRPDAARTALAAAEAAGADAAAVRAVTADILASEGNLDAAAGLLESLHATNPGRTDVLTRLARVAVRRATVAGARDVLRPALERVRSAIASGVSAPALQVAAARLELAAGESAAAKARLERAVSSDPASPEAWLLLGEATWRAGGPGAAARAASLLRRARLLRPRLVQLELVEAEVLLAGGDPAGAIVAATAYLRDHPGDRAALRLRARASRTLGLWAAVAADLREVQATGDTDEFLVVEIAESEFAAGNGAAAERAIAEAAPRVTPEVAAQLEAARALHSPGRLEAVDAAMQGAEGRAIAASLFLESGIQAEAVRIARESLTLAPGNVPGVRVLILGLLDRETPGAEVIREARAALGSMTGAGSEFHADFLEGRIRLAESRAAEAAESFTRAAGLLPRDPYVALGLGISRILCGSRDAGLEALRTAVGLAGPQRGLRRVVALWMARATAGLADAADRARIASEALLIDERSAPAAVVVAGALSELGEPRRAAETLERLLEAGAPDPATGEALTIGAAELRLTAGDTDRAIAHLGALPGAAGDSPRAAVIRGFAHLARGDADAADAVFRKAEGAGPPTALTMIGSARVLILRGDAAGAARRAVAWVDAGGDPAAALAVSRILSATSRREGALEVAARVRKARPDEPAALALVCDELHRAGRATEAVAEARAALAAAAAGPAGDLLRIQAARTLLGAGGDARAALDVALAVSRAAGLARSAAADAARVLQAECLTALGRSAEAMPILSALRASWRDDGPAALADRVIERRVRFTQGLIHAGSGALAPAAAEFSECVRLEPRDLHALNNLAWCEAQAGGNAAAAISHAKQLTEAQPEVADWWDTRAAAALAARDARDAEASLRKALAAAWSASADDPGAVRRRAVATLRLAELLAGSGRADEARKLASEVAASGVPDALRARARRIAGGAE